MKTKLLVVSVFVLSSFAHVFGDSRYELGTINDLIQDGTNFYYFEAQRELESPAWAVDTKIKVDDGVETRNLSEKLFIYPAELSQDEEHLYFAALSEECVGQILCDYQDVYKMSKKDGTFTVLAKNLKSSIHISLDSNFLHVSESSGNIWRIDKLDGSKSLDVQASEIVMDIVSKGDAVYWIEEISDQNSNVLTLEGASPNIIAKNLQIPYDLTVQDGILYWSEIQLKAVEGNFAEITAIKSYNGEIATLMEFRNTSPVSKALGQANYGPYLVFDDYLFLVNNTSDDSVIHMINLYNSTKYDIGTISDYDAKYLRTDGSSLFVVGKNENGFVIDRHSLPITVPEFPSIMLLVLPIAITSTIILSRFWYN